MKDIELIDLALNARKKAYAPYSNYYVGAALFCDNQNVYCGCNIENASYGATNCAERTAFFKAVSEGERSFTKIAICGAHKDANVIDDYAFPCGVCRQVMREFVNPDEFEVIVARSGDDYKKYKLSELLPDSFGPDNLK